MVRAVFPKGNTITQMRDSFGTVYQDDQFRALYPKRGQPAYAPWRLALVTVFQFLENLSDRQAAEHVRTRLDWKYALSLELEDGGFHYSVLSEFRARREGTPVRRTNRAGAIGTRLVDGIGPVALTFAVDIDPELPPTPPAGAALPVPDVTELVAARAALQEAQRRFAEASVRFAGGVA